MKYKTYIQISFMQKKQRQNVVCESMDIFDGMIRAVLGPGVMAVIPYAVLLAAFPVTARFPDDLDQLSFDGIEFTEFSEYEQKKLETLRKVKKTS